MLLDGSQNLEREKLYNWIKEIKRSNETKLFFIKAKNYLIKYLDINLSVNSALVLLSLLGGLVFLLLGVKDLTILFGSLLSLDPE